MRPKGLQLLFILPIISLCSACLKFEEFDFQTNKCKSAPSGIIRTTRLDNLRYSFSINNNSTASNSELVSVLWEIDGKTFDAFQVNYQFDKKGAKTIKVTFYNRCLMASNITNIIDVY